MRTLISVLCLSLIPIFAFAGKPEVSLDLDELCAIVDVAQVEYYAEERLLSNGKLGHRHFRCVGPAYTVDGCKFLIAPKSVAQAWAAKFKVDMWRGGANNGDGDGYSCSAEFEGERKRLPPTARAGADGQAPTNTHRPGHDWEVIPQ